MFPQGRLDALVGGGGLSGGGHDTASTDVMALTINIINSRFEKKPTGGGTDGRTDKVSYRVAFCY